jgi:hypothetical protein
VVVVAVVAGVVVYYKSRPSVTLRTLFSVNAYCSHLSADGSLVDVFEHQPDDHFRLPPIGQSIYDTKLGTVRLALPSVSQPIVFSLDSAFAGVANKGIYDLRSGQLILSLHSKDYSFSPDSRFVIAWMDGVYELPSGRQVVSANGLSATAFSADNRYVALIGTDDSVYDLSTGQQVFSAPTGKGVRTWVSLSPATFSPDGNYLSVESDGIYQVATGKKVVQTGAFSFNVNSAIVATALGVFDLASGNRIYPETLANDTTAYSKFSSDGKIAVILTYEPPARPTDAIITTVFDIQARKIVFQIRTPPEGRVYFDAILSPDGKSLAVWHDGVYDVATGKKRFAVDPKGGSTELTTAPLSFSKDNSLLYVSDEAAYDIQTGAVRFAMHGNTLDAIFGVSNDGRLLSDLVGVYDFATGIRLASGEVYFSETGNKTAVSDKQTSRCYVYETVSG